MRFVCHGVPRDMVGEMLYPLNQSTAVNPELYEFHRSKYVVREAALDFRIPGLNLLLGNTLHCAAVHPYYLFQATQAAGIQSIVGKSGSWGTGTFFAIPLERILHHHVVWCQHDGPGNEAQRFVNAHPMKTCQPL